MKTIWLVTGNGLQFFCFNRDDVAEAIAKAVGLMEMTGDSVVDGPSLDLLDAMLQNFNDPGNWQVNGSGLMRWHWKLDARHRIGAFELQPKALAKALCTMGQRWLES